MKFLLGRVLRQHPSLLGRVSRLLLASLALQAFPALSQSSPTAPRPFVMAADAESHTVVFYWSRLIYQEAFRRLGLPIEVTNFPLARRAILIEEGAIDGEVSRIFAYADAHPELVRVEEPVMDFTFAVFTAQPGLRAQKLDELPPTALVEYRRGILMCESLLKKTIPPERLSNVVTTEQALKKLLAGRSDAYCDIDAYVTEALRLPDLKGTTGVRKLFDIAVMPTYPYLYKKHVSLAPRLAAVVKQMKTEGLIAAYLKQAEREAGSGQ